MASKKLGITLDGTEYIVTVRDITEDITDHITGITPTTYVYSGEENKPTVITDGEVTLNEDYTVSYKNNVDIGTGTATISGINLYANEISFNFTITEPVTLASMGTNTDSTESVDDSILNDSEATNSEVSTNAESENEIKSDDEEVENEVES